MDDLKCKGCSTTLQECFNRTEACCSKCYHEAINTPKPLVLRAAFQLETVAHLRGLERELLPLAEHLRELHEMANNSLVTDAILDLNCNEPLAAILASFVIKLRAW